MLQGGPHCNQIQQTTLVLSPSPAPRGLGSGCSVSWQDLDLYAFHPVPSGKSDKQIVQSLVQEGHSDSSGLALHAMVLGSGESVFPNTHLSPPPPPPPPQSTNLVSQTFNGAWLRDLGNINLQIWFLELPQLSRFLVKNV